MAAPPPLHLKLRIVRGDARGPRALLGPGKAALMEAIRETGSISAAGRRMGMSYQRAWDLVADLNAAFVEPLVIAAKGGAGGGGAALTALGARILAAYRAIEAGAELAAAAELEVLRAALR